MPKLFGHLIGAWLLVSSVVHSQSVPGVSAAKQVELPQQHAQYKIDTTAILTNSRLPQLLVQVRRAPLVKHQSAQALPLVITSFFASFNKGRPLPIADVGGKFEATDFLVDTTLPRRQLLYLGISKNIVLLAYNLGGMSCTERILIFRLQGSSIQDFWTGGVKERQRQTTKEGILHYLQVHQQEDWGLNTNIVYF